MRALVLVSLFALSLGWTVARAGDPDAHEIYQAAEAGHMAQAESMVEQVLRDHPESARAHYVAAEVYARAGELPRARAELSRAEALKPGLSFAKPTSVSELRQQLEGRNRPAFDGRGGTPDHSFPWMWLLLGAGMLWLVFRLVSQFQRPRPVLNPYGTGRSDDPNALPGVLPPAGPAPAGGGLMHNLATGLAVGAGVAAGEALVEHMIPGAEAREAPFHEHTAGVAPDSNADLGGEDFGLNDTSSWSDDSGSGSDGGDWT